jgi:hypothetical protein
MAEDVLIDKEGCDVAELAPVVDRLDLMRKKADWQDLWRPFVCCPGKIRDNNQTLTTGSFDIFRKKISVKYLKTLSVLFTTLLVGCAAGNIDEIRDTERYFGKRFEKAVPVAGDKTIEGESWVQQAGKTGEARQGSPLKMIVIGTTAALGEIDKEAAHKRYDDYLKNLDEKKQEPRVSRGWYVDNVAGVTGIMTSADYSSKAPIVKAEVSHPIKDVVSFPLGSASMKVQYIQKNADLVAAEKFENSDLWITRRLCAVKQSDFSECSKRYARGMFRASDGMEVDSDFNLVSSGAQIDTKTFERASPETKSAKALAVGVAAGDTQVKKESSRRAAVAVKLLNTSRLGIAQGAAQVGGTASSGIVSGAGVAVGSGAGIASGGAQVHTASSEGVSSGTRPSSDSGSSNSGSSNSSSNNSGSNDSGSSNSGSSNSGSSNSGSSNSGSSNSGLSNSTEGPRTGTETPNQTVLEIKDTNGGVEQHIKTFKQGSSEVGKEAGKTEVKEAVFTEDIVLGAQVPVIVIGTTMALKEVDLASANKRYDNYLKALEEKKLQPTVTREWYISNIAGATKVNYSSIPGMLPRLVNAEVSKPMKEKVYFPSYAESTLLQSRADLVVAEQHDNSSMWVTRVLCSERQPDFDECSKRYVKGIFRATDGHEIDSSLAVLSDGDKINVANFEKIVPSK